MLHSDNASRFGFRIVGGTHNERRLVEWSTAFVAYAQCDERAEVNREAYLSAFCFGDSFRKHLDATGSTKSFSGDCWSPWLWFDIDRNDLDAARLDCLRLVDLLTERYDLDAGELLLFFSGSKGFHIGLPLTVCGSPIASRQFNQVCRKLAERLAELAGISIDVSVYDAVRAFRAPNSRHSKTGLHKLRFDLDALQRLTVSRLCELAQEPRPFELPEPGELNQQAVADWSAAAEQVERVQQAATERRSNGTNRTTLNRQTLEFIRDGATTGDRHRLLFSAAANLAEFGCPFDLAYALLSEAALDSGLSPSDVRRQIECGLNHRGAT